MTFFCPECRHEANGSAASLAPTEEGHAFEIYRISCDFCGYGLQRGGVNAEADAKEAWNRATNPSMFEVEAMKLIEDILAKGEGSKALLTLTTRALGILQKTGGWKPTRRHLKKTTYLAQPILTFTLEATMEDHLLYAGLDQAAAYPQIRYWARPTVEFNDGRFARIKE